MITVRFRDGSVMRFEVYQDERGLLRVRAHGQDHDLLGILKHTPWRIVESDPEDRVRLEAFGLWGGWMQ